MGCCVSSKPHLGAKYRSSVFQSSSAALRCIYWDMPQHRLPTWYDDAASSKPIEEKRVAIRTSQESFQRILAGDASRFLAMARFNTDLSPLSFFYNQFFCHLAVLRASAAIFAKPMTQQIEYMKIVLMMPIQRILKLDGQHSPKSILDEIVADTVAASEKLGFTSCYQFLDCYQAAYGALSTCLSADFLPVAESWQTVFSILIDAFRDRLPDRFFEQAVAEEEEKIEENETQQQSFSRIPTVHNVVSEKHSRRQTITNKLVRVSLMQAHTMKPLVWTEEEASVGFPWLDADHQWLYTMVTALYKAIKNNLKDGIDSVLAVASGLIDYTISHFGAEEAVFVEHNLDEVYIKSHQAEHDKFVEIVRDARKRLRKLQSYIRKREEEEDEGVHLPDHLFDHNATPVAASHRRGPSEHKEPEMFDLVTLYTFLRNWLHHHVCVKDQVYKVMIFG